MSIADEARAEAHRRFPAEDGPTPGLDRNTESRRAFIAGAEWQASRKPEAAPSAEFPCAFQLEQCRCDLPRGHDGLHECRAHKFSDRALVDAAPSDTDDGVWTCGHCGGGSVNHDALTGNTHVYEAVWKPSQPVQVEVTAEAVTIMAKYMANAASDWIHNDCGDDDHPLEHSNWTSYTDDARRALVAALGGGE